MFFRVLIGLICLYSVAFGQTADVLLHPNEGQWDSKIHFKVDMRQGSILVNETGFAYFLTMKRDPQKIKKSIARHLGPNS
jgi:hypothetical protein